MRNIKPILVKFLNAQKAYFREGELNLLLDSHPYPFSVDSITDTFDRLNIPSIAVHVDFNQLNEIQLPVISLVTEKGSSEFIIVKKILEGKVFLLKEDLREISLTVNDFAKHWEKVVIVIEVERKSRRINIQNLELSLIILGLLTVTIINTSSIATLLHSLLSFAGIITTAVIYSIENDNFSADRFCRNNGEMDCAAVLSSKESYLFGKLKLSDLSMTYFATLYLSIVFLGLTISPIIMLISSLALVIIPLSIFYQWQVIKKWCNLCLLISVLLILQFAIITNYGDHFPNTTIVRTVMVLCVALLLAIGIWFVLKKLIGDNWENKRFKFEALQFKRNDKLFFAAYEKQPPINNLSSFNSPVNFGNNDACIQIVIVSNPFCEPCANAHKVLVQLINTYPADIFIQYSFYFNDFHDPRRKIAFQLTASCIDSENNLDIIDKWYIKNSFSGAKNFSDLTMKSANNAMDAFYDFNHSNGINLTPTIILNGRVLPDIYQAESLIWLLPYLIEYLQKDNMRNTDILLQQNNPSR